ncbi:hypothetical protein ACTXT7_013174 [Hymenolepis weldensis]
MLIADWRPSRSVTPPHFSERPSAREVPLISIVTKQYAPESFLNLETQFRDYEIISQKVRFTCLLNDLTPEVAKPVHDFLEKPSTTPCDNLKFAILESMEELKLAYNI